MSENLFARPMLDQVIAYLGQLYGSGVNDVAPAGAGAWSTAFAFRLDGHDRIVRFGAIRDDFDRDAVAGGYLAPNLPIPQVTEIGPAFGGYFAVSDRMLGRYIDDIDGAEMRALLPSLFATLDAMRSADLTGTTGYGNWSSTRAGSFSSWRAMLLDIGDGDLSGDRILGWRQKLATSKRGTVAFEAGFGRLRANIDACPEDRHLIHSDLLNKNVLVQGDRISAVFDWGCSLYGDFLYDLAWFIFWQPWYPAWSEIDFAAEAKRHFAAIGLAVPNVGERLRCYQIHIGLDSLRFNAFVERWDSLETVAHQVLALCQ